MDEPLESNGGALVGLKVVDITWALVGPTSTRFLADLGATVVHVETSGYADPARTAPPFKDATPGPERSGGFANFNANKLGLTLNLRNPVGRDVFLRLVRWCDVLVESFTPRVMPSLGLSYEALRVENPSLVMVSTCLHGQTGPDAERAGYGIQGAGQAGFTGFLGWPDRPPALPGAYTDFVASRMASFTLLAALDHRRRTGVGQHVDLSQIESSIHFVAPAILNFTVNGAVAQRTGNRVDGAVPHGVFPCRGEDSWVAIAIETDEQWKALAAAAGRPAWTSDARFATAAARAAHEPALEEEIAAWTRGHTAEAVELALQAAGAPAAAVHHEIDLGGDSQLQHREFWRKASHATLGTVVVEGPRVLFSRTPGAVRRVPTLGGDNSAVLRDLLGLDDAEIADLTIAGALD